jgi:hypothetical protein
MRKFAVVVLVLPLPGQSAAAQSRGIDAKTVAASEKLGAQYGGVERPVQLVRPLRGDVAVAEVAVQHPYQQEEVDGSAVVHAALNLGV